MVTNWQQDNNITLRQTTTTTMTKEVVIPKRTPTVQQLPSLSHWTAKQIATSFAALGRPMIQAATVPPLTESCPKGRQLSSRVINDGFTTTERATHATGTSSILPGHFDPPTPPTEEDPSPPIPMQMADEPLPIPPPTILFATKASLFTPPRTKTQISKSDPPVFPMSHFTKWMATSTTRNKLLSELVQNKSSITNQFAAFASQ